LLQTFTAVINDRHPFVSYAIVTAAKAPPAAPSKAHDGVSFRVVSEKNIVGLHH
jgi:hypothetical protein